MSKKFSAQTKIITLYEDDEYIAFYKPAGLLTVPTDREGDTAITLTASVNQSYRRRPDLQSQKVADLLPCHRLDKETSGVIVFAKNQQAQAALMNQFKEKKVYKKYIAFVHGHLKKNNGSIHFPIRDLNVKKFGQASPLKEALTKYHLLEQRKRFAIVEAMPITGRTNQLRIHFKEIGHPLVGENKFIFRRDVDLKFKRTALHASWIKFQNPFSGKNIEVQAPLSTDMKNFLERNRQ